MFAIFKNGGKQYKVRENQVLQLEKLNAEFGQQIELNEIMMVGEENAPVAVGAPFVKGASVKIEVIDHTKDEKVIIFKKRRRKNYRRKNGHRQPITIVKVITINKG